MTSYMYFPHFLSDLGKIQ